MASSQLLVGFLVSLLLFLSCLLVIYERGKKKTPTNAGRLPPGPRGFPIVGNLLSISGDLHRCFADLADVYGPIFSLRLGAVVCVVLSSPEVVKAALKDNDVVLGNHEPPALSAEKVRRGGAGILFQPYGAMWRELRKATVRELLSGSRLDGGAAVRVEEVCRAVAAVRPGLPVPVWEVAFRAGLNVVLRTLFGYSIPVNEGSFKSELMEIVDNMVVLLAKPNVSDFFPVLAPFDFQGLERKMKKLFDRYEVVFEEMVNAREKEDKVEFVHRMLELVDTRVGDRQISRENVNTVVLDLIGGGTDTTATTIEWTMAELMRNPEAMRRVQKEIDEAVGVDRHVSESDFPKLPYLEVVVWEIERLHPAIPLLIPHVPSSACTIGGYLVPEKSKVFFNVWAIHRDPSIWDRPLEFWPERWLSAAVAERHDLSGSGGGGSFEYLPFGAGRRSCPGAAFGQRVVMLTVASLVHAFEWSLPSGNGEVLDMEEKFGVVMKKAKPLVAVPTARFRNPELYAQ